MDGCIGCAYCTTTQTCCLQSVNIGLMAWVRWEIVSFFKGSLNEWTWALVFYLQKGEYNTYMVFQYQTLRFIIKRTLKQKHISYFYLNFFNTNVRANFYTLSPNNGENQLNTCDPSHILVAIDLFVCVWLHNKFAKIKDIQIGLDFVINNLKVFLVGFLFQPTNIKADALNC